MSGIYRVSDSLMSTQICNLVYNSIDGFVDFFERFDINQSSSPNPYEFAHPAFTVTLIVIHYDGNDIPAFEFDPPFDVLKDKLLSSLEAIIQASLGMSRLEIAVEELTHNKDNPFGIMKSVKKAAVNLLAKHGHDQGDEDLYETNSRRLYDNKNHIKGVSFEDKAVRHARKRLTHVIATNRVEPEHFLRGYHKFQYIYSGGEEAKIKEVAANALLSGNHKSIPIFEKEICRLRAVEKEILAHSMDIVTFFMVEVQVYDFKQSLIQRVRDLHNMLVSIFVSDLYSQVISLNARYESMSEMLNSIPKVTEELCSLKDYYNEAPNVIRNMELEFTANGGVKDRQLFAISHGYEPTDHESSVNNMYLYIYILTHLLYIMTIYIRYL